VVVTAADQRRVDADFAAEVLARLYSYRQKRLWVAKLLWLPPFGLFGAHRFYLDRPGTGLLMASSFGGAFIWWVIDGFLLRSMVDGLNSEQDLRQRVGMPPRELDFMPPLQRDVLAKPPDWTYLWRAAPRWRRFMRFAGDVFVLAVLGSLVGTVARVADVWEAVFAILVLVTVTAAGGAVNRFAHVPVVRGLLLWSHRLRLFYYYSAPRGPIGLLFRPISAVLVAPLRRRDRAEVRIYLQLGAVLTALFLIIDFGADILGPVIAGEGLPGLLTMAWLWISEAVFTFIVIYGFATPIGAILNLYVLMMRTHLVPRILGALVTVLMLMSLFG
jgi:TM2 domain-containing membrane protein YozV